MTDHPLDSTRPYASTVLRFEDLTIDLRQPVAPNQAEALRHLGLAGPFGVVTACNPCGEKAPAADNARRTRRLFDELATIDEPIPVDGCSPDLAHREASFAIAADEVVVRGIARRFDQEAYFWFDGADFWLVFSVGNARLRLPHESGA